MINITIVITSETCIDGKYNPSFLLEKFKELVTKCTYNLDSCCTKTHQIGRAYPAALVCQEGGQKSVENLQIIRNLLKMAFVSRSERFEVGKWKLEKSIGFEIWRDSKI